MARNLEGEAAQCSKLKSRLSTDKRAVKLGYDDREREVKELEL
jgi:hypothetical protein